MCSTRAKAAGNCHEAAGKLLEGGKPGELDEFVIDLAELVQISGTTRHVLPILVDLIEHDDAATFSSERLVSAMRTNVAAPLLLAQALHDQLPPETQGVVVNLLDAESTIRSVAIANCSSEIVVVVTLQPYFCAACTASPPQPVPISITWFAGPSASLRPRTVASTYGPCGNTATRAWRPWRAYAVMHLWNSLTKE